MIIDIHCHAGPGDGLTGPWDTDAPLDAYRRRAAAAGIAHTVIFPAFHTDYARANAGVARIVAADRARFTGFAFVHAARDRGRIEAMVRACVAGHGFRGIKVHRHDAPITREVCDTARALDVPVLYDVMGEVATVELLATAYPDVRFLIPHLGSFADEWSAQVSFLGFLERHPNVYTDTSGVRRFDLLEIAVKRAGAHKVLFGSDGPWLHPAAELSKVRLLALPHAEERMVLCENASRLLRPSASSPITVSRGSRSAVRGRVTPPSFVRAAAARQLGAVGAHGP